MSRIITSVKTRTMPVLLIVALVFSMVIVPPKKAEAIAPVVVGGGAAVAALGVELGITTEAVVTALVAICAAGTGVYVAKGLSDADFRGIIDRDTESQVYDNWKSEYQNWKAPDGRSWNDLTQEEKDAYKTPANYVSNWLWLLSLQMGAITQTDNGMEPTPEPDPEEDPEGHKRWQDLRNMLILMGTGAGTVALSDLVNFFGDQVGMNLRNLIYGDPVNDKGLGCLYTNQCSVDGVNVYMSIVQKVNSFEPNSSDWTGVYSFNELTWPYMQENPQVVSGTTTKYNIEATENSSTYDFILTKASSNYYAYSSTNADQLLTCRAAYDLAWNYKSYTQNRLLVVYAGDVNQTWRGYINAIYSGSYTFPNGAIYSNGRWTNNTGVLEAVDYGQITGYPQGMANGSTNDEEYKRAGAAFNQTAPSGNQYAARMPSDWSNVSEWSDLVSPIPEEQVTPLPDYGLWPGADPSPNPNPNPNDPEFTEDFSEEVGKLLRQPFDQLFPFCLIGDLQRLVNMIKDAGSNGNRTRGIGTAAEEEPLNGTQELVIPLSGFGIEGIDDITFDLTVVSQLAHYVRPMMTGLFVCGLLVGSFAFFLKRGGE